VYSLLGGISRGDIEAMSTLNCILDTAFAVELAELLLEPPLSKTVDRTRYKQMAENAFPLTSKLHGALHRHQTPENRLTRYEKEWSLAL
jgi:hypothetical protein